MRNNSFMKMYIILFEKNISSQWKNMYISITKYMLSTHQINISYFLNIFSLIVQCNLFYERIL